MISHVLQIGKWQYIRNYEDEVACSGVVFITVVVKTSQLFGKLLAMHYRYTRT